MLIHIKGLQAGADSGEEGVIESITTGILLKTGDGCCLKYEELQEGTEGTCDVLVKARPGCLTVTRRGYLNMSMEFKEDSYTQSSYRTDIGYLLLGLYTKRVEVTPLEDGVDISAAYTIEAGETFLSENSIEISARYTGEGEKRTAAALF